MAPAERYEQLEPLTRRNKAGELYTRLEAVEIQIHAALELDPAALYARAKISDRTAAEYLENECVAYLVRDAFRRGDHERFSTLASILLRRCPLVESGIVPIGRPGRAGSRRAEPQAGQRDDY